MDNYNYSFLYVYAMQGQKCVHAILKTSRTKDATSEAAEVIKHFPKILFFFFFCCSPQVNLLVQQPQI